MLQRFEPLIGIQVVRSVHHLPNRERSERSNRYIVSAAYPIVKHRNYGDNTWLINQLADYINVKVPGCPVCPADKVFVQLEEYEAPGPSIGEYTTNVW